MVEAHEILIGAHELYARSGGGAAASKDRPPVYKIVGLLLAVASGLFIGVSFVLKKYGLLKANAKYNEEAGEGYGYLKNAWWWTGMILMIIGEVCNFVAYAFVDAILVTPLGALSVVVTTILSAIFLKERLSFVGKVGCFVCVIGAVVIAINAPEQSSVATIQDMKRVVLAPGFLSYAGVVIVGCTFVALWAGPRYGKKSMLVYLTICSLIGGLSVVATQGLGAAILTQIAGTPQFNQWFLYVLLVFVIATLLTEIIYLNKALNLFNAALVTPTYYVYFTTATIVTSAILFQGFKGTPAQITTVIMGFLQICSGVVLLQLSKSAKDVPDTAVFKGDLDQVRTIAEVEEPEYEPRADTIRGGAAIVRAISRKRDKREAEEAKHLREEHMAPIGEDEQVEFDGLRRRRTVVHSGQPTIRRQKTIHPPLGMSHFPDPNEENSDDEIHPGVRSYSFRNPFGSRSRGNSRTSRDPSVPLSPIKPADPNDPASAGVAAQPYDSAHTLGNPSPLHTGEDTAYHSSSSSVQWASNVQDSKARDPKAPLPPPHGGSRQYSFQSSLAQVFHRHKDGPPSPHGSGDGASEHRPISRGALSFSSRKSSYRGAGGSRGGGSSGGGATEEERLGLVKGDSQSMLPESGEYRDERSSGEEEDRGWHRQATASAGAAGASALPDRSEADLGRPARFRRGGDLVEESDEDDEGGAVSGKEIEAGPRGGNAAGGGGRT